MKARADDVHSLAVHTFPLAGLCEPQVLQEHPVTQSSTPRAVVTCVTLLPPINSKKTNPVFLTPTQLRLELRPPHPAAPRDRS